MFIAKRREKSILKYIIPNIKLEGVCMRTTDLLKQEIKTLPKGTWAPNYFRSVGYLSSRHTDNACQRADAVYSLFTEPKAHIYQNDLIAGSMRSMFAETNGITLEKANAVVSRYPERYFGTNADHFSPDYSTVVSIGLPGLLKKIESSKQKHAAEPERFAFLEAMRITLYGLRARLLKHADLCAELLSHDGYSDDKLHFIEDNCRCIADHAPATFAQALQLVWMIHTGFVYEGRYAMALGRIDQYLYPFFKHDLQNGTLTLPFATELLENVFIKIYERHVFLGGDDVVNICIGGMNSEGQCEVNELSYAVLEAVKNCNVSGPNLSARITPNTPDRFLDACLQVIGTGLGYPALMNDTINLEALSRYGYRKEDVYNYSMVGCIENFITGMQPPWSDGRFDTPRFLEYVFYNGKSYDGLSSGLDTGDVSEIISMDDLMSRLEKQLDFGAENYVREFHRYNHVEFPENYTSPYLSCFCRDCIERGLDINMGGSVYPSVHGAALMGVGTMSDSLAAIEQTVFIDHACTLEELREALKANFVGYEALHEKLLAAPKYGNNDPLVDKYAVWFVDYLAKAFGRYKTEDGGSIYIAMAANTSNISAGAALGATPDGRHAHEPLSDASSPSYGKDVNGPTMTVLSITKPDYRQVACGSVVNQKFSPSMFKDGKREKLLQLIRVYFSKGGQEMQINATSSDVLKDAMEHPENYENLVVRVSGFSAFYVTLCREVQMDILKRTQQG